MLEETLQAKLKEAEALAAQVKQQGDHDGAAQTALILRWAVIADEVTALMLQAEEQLPPARLAHLKAKLAAYWPSYRKAPWRLPQFRTPPPNNDIPS